jgi:peroxiredoxin family protein
MKVRFFVCQSSLDLMDISRQEVMEGVEYAGVTSFLGTACNSRMVLFV